MKRHTWDGLAGPLVAILILAAVFSLSFTRFQGIASASAPSPPEKYAVEIYLKTNGARALYGLPPLEKCGLLDGLARTRAGHVAGYYNETGELEHYLLDQDVSAYLPSLQSVGENAFAVDEGLFCFGLCVPAQGASGGGMVEEWMNSPGHRKNILSARFGFVGVDVERAAGRLIAIQLFSSSCAGE